MPSARSDDNCARCTNTGFKREDTEHMCCFRTYGTAFHIIIIAPERTFAWCDYLQEKLLDQRKDVVLFGKKLFSLNTSQLKRGVYKTDRFLTWFVCLSIGRSCYWSHVKILQSISERACTQMLRLKSTKEKAALNIQRLI